MREWIIELTSKEADLERLVGLRDSDAGWWVERDDRRGVVLRSSRLDALEDRSEVRQAAANLVSLVDIAARLSVHRFGGVALADCVLGGLHLFEDVGAEDICDVQRWTWHEFLGRSPDSASAEDLRAP